MEANIQTLIMIVFANIVLFQCHFIPVKGLAGDNDTECSKSPSAAKGQEINAVGASTTQRVISSHSGGFFLCLHGLHSTDWGSLIETLRGHAGVTPISM